jgi:hypothetical protein
MLSKAVAAARGQLRDISANLSNQVRGPMKTFGLVVPEDKGRKGWQPCKSGGDGIITCNLT